MGPGRIKEGRRHGVRLGGFRRDPSPSVRVHLGSVSRRPVPWSGATTDVSGPVYVEGGFGTSTRSFRCEGAVYMTLDGVSPFGRPTSTSFPYFPPTQVGSVTGLAPEGPFVETHSGDSSGDCLPFC